MQNVHIDAHCLKQGSRSMAMNHKYTTGRIAKTTFVKSKNRSKVMNYSLEQHTY